MVLISLPLQATETNLFEGETLINKAGRYELIIYAYDAQSGNTEVDKVNYVIYN